ncbi:hypothetical protein NQ318_012677 [Aromia moschata]|uniref:Uncharacterized protein n=1 Tax=Aromia moschata TaxID=1265417 RepID=A0AAV8YH70_9CUCU|nr:hypothetical protein NQ318_012677 [Aromia moschata]
MIVACCPFAKLDITILLELHDKPIWLSTDETMDTIAVTGQLKTLTGWKKSIRSILKRVGWYGWKQHHRTIFHKRKFKW